jgi:predicted PurR-regulated permease PerM
MEILLLIFIALAVIVLLKSVVETIIKVMINFIKTIVVILIALVFALFLLGGGSLFQNVFGATQGGNATHTGKPVELLRTQPPMDDNFTVKLED